MFFQISLAYFVYTFVFRIEFFPFMNVLTAVIAVGVGADDTFILYKAWQEAAAEAEAASASPCLPLSKVVRCALNLRWECGLWLIQQYKY